MRTIAVLVALTVAACSAEATDAADVETVGVSPLADDAGADAAPPPDRECDGSNARHICGAFRATSSFRYGVTTKCTGTPFLQPKAGEYVARAEGREGCIAVTQPDALCCP